jgi:hypothetical protein
MHTGQNGSTESEQCTTREKNTVSSIIIGIGADEQDSSGKVVFQQGTNARATHEEHSFQFGTAGKKVLTNRRFMNSISPVKVHTNKVQ